MYERLAVADTKAAPRNCEITLGRFNFDLDWDWTVNLPEFILTYILKLSPVAKTECRGFKLSKHAQ